MKKGAKVGEENRTRMAIACAILALVLLGIPCTAAEGPPLNAVLITIDTLRPDHLECYGYPSIRTPNIDRLAREGVKFTQAYTPVPITLPAHAALMTGEFPLATGIHDFSGNKLAPTLTTIARELHNHGYSTAAFVASPVLDSRFGLNQGFDTYFDHFDFGRQDVMHLDAIKRRGDRVVAEALRWLRSSPRRPFFLWAHLYDAHAPYDPPEPYASRYRARPYDGEIAFADAQVGRLLDFLRQHRLSESSLVVLASDHGESLGEHGEKTHGFFIYNSTLHVPLIFRLPGAEPRVVQDEVSLVDVAPTVLQALKVPIPASVQGRSLLDLVLGHPTRSASILYAESYPPLLHFGWNLLQGVQWHGMKYIQTTRPELYDTRTDPKELHNLLSTRPAVGQEMSGRLDHLIQRLTPAVNASTGRKELTDPALLAQLRSLGYVAVAAGTVPTTRRNNLPDPKDRIQVYEKVSAALSDDARGRYEQSLHSLQQAARTETRSPTIQFLIAQDYLRLRDFPHAAEYFRSVLNLDPKNSPAAYYLGLSQLQAGDLEAARHSFQHTLNLDPLNFSAAFDLGVVYTRQHQANAAVQAFQHAIEILPDYAEAHEALGELYLYLNRTNDAVQELQRAIAIDPKMYKAHFQLARAFAALGLHEKAQQEFDRARAH